MNALVRDYVELPDHSSLDVLIERLIATRNRLPNPAKAEVRLRGDDVFGRSISISYLRPQTEAEAECDSRYSDAYLESLVRKLGRLQDEIAATAKTGLRLAG